MWKLFLVGTIISCSFAIDCLNEQQQAVDWWVILKMPKITGVFPNGDAYYYCDSNNHCQTIKRGLYTMNDLEGPFLSTVAQISQQDMQIAWNDQTQRSTLSTHAHSKGLIVGSKSGQAIIINHSMPQFPNLDASGNIEVIYPSNALTYGQHILCVSTDLTEVERVAVQQITAECNVFYSKFSLSTTAYPNLFKLSNQKYSKMNLYESFLSQMRSSRMLNFKSSPIVDFKSRKGQVMKSFTYSPSWTGDFYDTIVTQGLEVGLVVETWGSGVGGLSDPICTEYPSMSNLVTVMPNGESYKYTKDHSKYAVSLDSSSPYVCLSDMNRQTTQQKRGGTAICIENISMWNSFDKIMSQRQSC